jgi:hypothetical protein
MRRNFIHRNTATRSSKMYQQFDQTTFALCRKPYEHAGQEFSSEFLLAGLASGSYDDWAAWAGHGDL